MLIIKSLRFISLILLFFSLQFVQAQYFGQNKVKYKNFDFKVLESPTYEIYHYIDNDSLTQALANEAETWQQRHVVIFKDTFDYKIPIILYANHGDFQQTSAVNGIIGTTTGGVTEGLKNRVIFPLTNSYAQTDHVMGHELVHAHQYNMIKSGDSLSLKNMANIPLWMTEGMAEYFSIGSEDAHTAMWMRDAVAYDYFPAIKDMYKSRYFPYRFGHAFWAFVGGTFGDDRIIPLYKETAKVGVKEAFKRELYMPTDSFSKKWKTTTEAFYNKFKENRNLAAEGTKLVDNKNGGRLNISPAVSPDGKYFIFLSEKNIFTIDLFLADASNGKIIRKISKRTRQTHLDALDSFESAGTWSPDSKQYAFVGYSEGRNKIIIAAVNSGKITDEFFIKGIPSFNNIDWSPDGKKIVFTGLKEGISDLFTIDLKTKKLTQLTHDAFADMQPRWSPDGSQIVFVTDKVRDAENPCTKLSFAIFDLETGKSYHPEVFPGANNLNPTFGKEGKFIYFLSDRDGFRDIYRYNVKSEKIEQLTRFYTGVSGITKYAPAISIPRSDEVIFYSLYEDSKYNIYKVAMDKLTKEGVKKDEVDMSPAVLPSMNLHKSIVDKGLISEVVEVNDSLSHKAYQPKFKLDYISNSGVGMSTGTYGTGMSGGINMLFGDMLNYNQLFVGALVNGEVQDFGAQVVYLNKKSRLNWGGGLSHIPYRYLTGGYSYDTITINGQQVRSIKETYNIYRVFKEQAAAFTSFPFSKVNRVEAQTSFNRYSYRLDKYHNYYDDSGYFIYYYGQERERNVKEGLPDAFNLMDVSLAYVGDDSSYGMTAPMQGYRYRLEFQQNFGRLNMSTALVDIRKYFYVKPVTFAFKAYHYSRLGKDASNTLMSPLYLGYETLIRGYNSSAFYNTTDQNYQETLNNLLGSRMLLGNVELRFPFTGPERLAFIKSGFLFTDLNLFFDAGMAWGDYQLYNYNTSQYDQNTRKFEDSKIISSFGISTRINLFGQIILEPYYAFPLQLENNSKGVFGLNFVPGW